ncbi:odr-4 -like protein, partial [Brachionus plicatilis]
FFSDFCAKIGVINRSNLRQSNAIKNLRFLRTKNILNVDGKANDLLNNLIQNGQETKTGLLIGTIDSSKDYITLVIPTPKSEESCDKANASWAINHALLVHDMLVGGWDILGIYSIDQAPLSARSLLSKIFKSLNDLEYYKEMKFNTDRLLFLVDTQKKTINMKSLDISVHDNKNYQSCEIKVARNLLKNEFVNLSAKFNLNSIFKVLNVYSYNILKKDFLKALPVGKYFEDEKFLCLLNNELFGDEKQFCEIAKMATIKQEEICVSLIENLGIVKFKYKFNKNSSFFDESKSKTWAKSCDLLTLT